MEIYVINKQNSNWRNNSSRSILKNLAHNNHWGLPYYLESGKPMLPNAYLSISHSHDLLIIVYAKHEVGVDCELIRPIDKSVINRLELELNNPILDWCKRESIIKLMDDKDYLFKKELNEFFFKEITLNSRFCIVISAKNKIEDYRIIQCDENLNIIDEML